MHLMLAAALLVSGIAQAQSSGRALVPAEFRVFDGMIEVTGAVTLRALRAGASDASAVEVPLPTATLPAGVYEVQVRHAGRGVTAVKSIEGIVVMHYPDERRHLEVINLQPGFGALQVRSEVRGLAASDVTLFDAGDRTAAAAAPVAGPDYLLFVVPAGRYDLRVHAQGADGLEETRWIFGIDLPADRTRLTLIDAPGL